MTREEAIKIINCYDIGFYDLSGEKITADKLAEAFDMAIEALSAEAVPQSEQYKKGFEDAKRAILVEYARESQNMRKRNAQLEVMLNAQKAISADRPRPIDPTIEVDLESGVVPISACEPKGPKTIIYADRPRGRWHYSDGKPATIGQSFGVICDQCGAESEYCTNFCGECGSDMRGDTE